ncbi:MAG: AzlD domain-containing protein [Hyphomicrobiales bacterium]
MMNTLYVILAIIAMSIITFALRAIPFIMPKRLFESPSVQNPAKLMPFVVMAILVLNAFKGTKLDWSGSTIPLLSGISVVAALQTALRMPLVSIVGGVGAHILCLILLQ